MNRQCVGGIIPVLFLCGLAAAAGDPQKPARDVPELAALSQYVGNWDIDVTIKNSEHPQGAQTKGSSVGEWIHDGRFLRQTWSLAENNGLPAMNGSIIRTYDPRKMTYRSWTFDSAGFTEESQGTWNAESRTMKWIVRDNLSGGSTVSESTFPEEGRETWSVVVKDDDGEIVADVQGKSTRKE